VNQSPRLIELRDLTRKNEHGDRTILDRISLIIDAGQRIGLVGPSGSGKTSLMRAIAKLDPVERGMLTDRGQRISRELVPGYRCRTIYLFQRSGFRAGSVIENLELPFQLAVSGKAFDRHQAERWLERFGKSAAIIDQPIESLSGGEQQMIALIRALGLAPEILLLDEPTASLDGASTERYEELVLEWFHADPNHRSFLWSSHDVDQVRRMTTCCIEMDHGKLVKPLVRETGSERNR